jgi:hypothetical protein
MGNSTSILSYPDIKAVLDRVIAGENLRVSFDTHGAAVKFVSRCNSFRRLDRKDNFIIYPDPGQTLHGRSIYDAVSVVIDKSDDKAVLVRQMTADAYTLEVI